MSKARIREGVLDCKALWQLIAIGKRTFGDDKIFYLNALGIYGGLHDCPMCLATEYQYAYSISTADVACSACLDWSKYKGRMACISEGSPYLTWMRNPSNEKKLEAAHKIVELCDKWLAENGGAE